MGGEFEVIVSGHDADYAKQASTAAFEELAALELDLSRFVETSDVSRINALGKGQSTRVGPAAFECLTLALRVGQETRGAFDVTYRSARLGVPPSGGSAKLALDKQNHSVTVLMDNVKLDLGGIAKGYAVDQMVELLREWDIQSALVHADYSTVFAMGKDVWKVGLRDPRDAAQELGKIDLREAALSGSGVQVQGAHIIDPRTGQPARAALAAWALAPTAGVADALSTAFMVMAREEIAAYCRAHAGIGAAIMPVDAHELVRFGTLK